MIALTGGKTGGHIMPLLALSKELDDVIFVGSKDSLEERLCKKHNITFMAMPLKRSFFSILKCFFKLKLPKIEGVITTGGFVSLPLLFYAILHKIPIYVLEENVIMGMANQVAAIFAKKVFLVYPLPKMKKKYEVVGLPILYPRGKSYEDLDFSILILGGSLGSKPLCDLVYQLNKRYKICLIAGRYSDAYKNIFNVTVFSYVDDLRNLMKQAKVIISRAGASTTYEIFSVGKPCIIIPSMQTKKNHQYLNALYFEKEKCALLLREKESRKYILDKVNLLMENDALILNMQLNQKRIFIKDAGSKIKMRIRGEEE